jgi:hypothetical protein
MGCVQRIAVLQTAYVVEMTAFQPSFLRERNKISTPSEIAQHRMILRAFSLKAM